MWMVSWVSGPGFIEMQAEQYIGREQFHLGPCFSGCLGFPLKNELICPTVAADSVAAIRPSPSQCSVWGQQLSRNFWALAPGW